MLIGIILLIIALTELFIGFWFLVKYKNNQATFWYGLVCLGVTLYVGANGIGYLGIFLNGNIAERIAWLGALLFTISFLSFVYSYPVVKKKAADLMVLIIWPLAVFAPVFLWTNFIIKNNGILHYREGYTRAFGEYFWYFLIFFLVYWLWSIIILGQRLKDSDGLHRRNLMIILWGVLISLFAGVIFDIILPLTHPLSNFGYIGSLFTSVWLGVTSYILLKK